MLHWIQRNDFAYSRIVAIQLVIAFCLFSTLVFTVMDLKSWEERIYGPTLKLSLVMLFFDMASQISDLFLIRTRYRFLLIIKDIAGAVAMSFGVAVVAAQQLLQFNYEESAGKMVFLVSIYFYQSVIVNGSIKLLMNFQIEQYDREIQAI